MRSLIIIPAYNEAENIENVLRDIRMYCPQLDYIIINDCSTDNTCELLKRIKANYLDLPINLGIGGAVQAGYRYAENHYYDIAIQFDGDGQHMAEYIKDLIAPIEKGKADVVIGSRFLNKQGFQSSVMRRLGIRYLSNLIFALCGVKIQDVTSGFRAVNRKMIVYFAKNYAQDYPEPEAILASGCNGAIIEEVPVLMRERKNGKSSITPVRSMYYILKVSFALLLLWMANWRRKT